MFLVYTPVHLTVKLVGRSTSHRSHVTFGRGAATRIVIVVRDKFATLDRLAGTARSRIASAAVHPKVKKALFTNGPAHSPASDVGTLRAQKPDSRKVKRAKGLKACLRAAPPQLHDVRVAFRFLRCTFPA